MSGTSNVYGDTPYGKRLTELGLTASKIAEEVMMSRQAIQQQLDPDNFNLKNLRTIGIFFEKVPVLLEQNGTQAPCEYSPEEMLPYLNSVLPVEGRPHDYKTLVLDIDRLAQERGYSPKYLPNIARKQTLQDIEERLEGLLIARSGTISETQIERVLGETDRLEELIFRVRRAYL